jgi:hypothetical protein
MTPMDGIVQFNKDRNLNKFDNVAEYNMLHEELMEFLHASSQEFQEDQEVIDALCDIIVVATGAIHKLGYDPEKALNETVKEITSRRGSFNEDVGKWEKDLSQDPSTLYKANYSNCKVG